MRRIAPVLLTLLLPVLAACSTTVLDEKDRELPESTGGFSRETVKMNPDESYISFIGKSSGNVISHEGKFETFTFSMTPNKSNPSDLTKATINVEIDMTSARTDAEGLNGHLQKADFFDTATYPTATFRSTKIEKTGNGEYRIGGDLTIKGKTQKIGLQAKITNEYITLKHMVTRANFGIGNDAYGEKILDKTVPVEAKIVFQD